MALRTLVSKRTLSAGLGFRQQFRGVQTFSLPDLPYDYGALEPAISGDIMQLHHQKHHQTYITNYNKALNSSMMPSPKEMLLASPNCTVPSNLTAEVILITQFSGRTLPLSVRVVVSLQRVLLAGLLTLTLVPWKL
ncbi:Superoxide dismutase [Mn], mitochondrial [Capsicum chinense]|nr:Superoxide dismutase [Mn], mitochondrial [Capsicum chinense]